MLDHRILEQNPDDVAAKLSRRGPIAGLDNVVAKIKQRKEVQSKLEAKQRLRNEINNELKKASKDVIEQKRVEMRTLSDEIKVLDEQHTILSGEIESALLMIPNIPQDSVPDGKDSEDNVVVRTLLEPRQFSFPVKDHVDLGQHLRILDTERAAKVSGSRFSFLRGAGAKLERALAAFMLDFHLDRGDTELAPPFLVAARSMQGTGQLPKFKDDAFALPFGEGDPLYLIPTSEVPVTNYYADEILDEEVLPVRFAAFSACFRAEAGSAGRDTRGLIRQHQFDKVEMVRFAAPEQAAAELDAMVQRASDIMTALELPHRVVLLCAGDMGFSSEKTYDLEVWLPGQNAYREISSCSTFGSFQARRAKIRYRPKAEEGAKKAPSPRPLVTLNGSGLAVGRTLVALLENHQQEDGSIRVPAALRPYMGGLDVIQPPAGDAARVPF